MRAVVGGLLVMSTGNTLKVTGKDTAAGWSITTTGTVIETGITVGKTGIRTMIASSRGMNTDPTNLPDTRLIFMTMEKVSHE